MKKRTLVILFMFLLLLNSCKSSSKKVSDNNSKNNVKIGIVLSVGGLGDKSFNDSADRGVKRAEKDFGINVNVGQPSKMSEDKLYLTRFASMNYDLVIGIGFLMHDAVEEVAKRYPKVHFAIVDSVVNVSNVKSIVFKEEEGSFLVGALAAMKTKAHYIGFIGGMKVPLIKKFEFGYEQGAYYIDPNIKLDVLYVGSGQQAFHDPVKGEELANTLYSKGADIIYHAAGSTGNGVINAAQKNKKLVIGVDSNQDYLAPGFVLTSMVKHVDNAVYKSIKDVISGDFKGGVYDLGLKEKGVNYSLDEYNKELITEDMKVKIEKIRKDIIEGKIKVDVSKINN
ncbi:BMP family ABC transporter substrate-binding protein [bacterium]|nr:BMP family ABC transporter substrate-binding protein [bacterium]